jgi:hypothetical protein
MRGLIPLGPLAPSHPRPLDTVPCLRIRPPSYLPHFPSFLFTARWVAPGPSGHQWPGVCGPHDYEERPGHFSQPGPAAASGACSQGLIWEACLCVWEGASASLHPPVSRAQPRLNGAPEAPAAPGPLAPCHPATLPPCHPATLPPAPCPLPVPLPHSTASIWLLSARACACAVRGVCTRVYMQSMPRRLLNDLPKHLPRSAGEMQEYVLDNAREDIMPTPWLLGAYHPLHYSPRTSHHSHTHHHAFCPCHHTHTPHHCALFPTRNPLPVSARNGVCNLWCAHACVFRGVEKVHSFLHK